MEKLTDREILALRALYRPGVYGPRRLARKFEISLSYASKLAYGLRRALPDNMDRLRRHTIGLR